jgi:hypothetical protein
MRHRHSYDLAELSAAEYWALVRGEHCESDLLERLVSADADAWACTNDAVIEWLCELRAAGLRIGLLSNMPFEMWQAIASRQTWLDLCDEVTLSYERRAAKPDPAIYVHCLERLGLTPQKPYSSTTAGRTSRPAPLSACTPCSSRMSRNSTATCSRDSVRRCRYPSGSRSAAKMVRSASY